MTDRSLGPRGVQLGVDPPLSPLGLGAWSFGRTGWGEQDDRDSRAAILRAAELGINWIDTAAVYGDGHSERLVGCTLKNLPEPERPLIFTKGGLRIDRSSGATFRDLRPASLRQDCEQSLDRLGVEHIDLYQLHWPVADPLVVEEAWLTLGDLKDEGKIRWAGVSNFDVPLLDHCARRRRVDATQSPLSLLSRDSCLRQLPWAQEHEARGLTYSPLESGLLSGAVSSQRLQGLPPSDWRAQRDQFRQPKLGRTLSLVERLKPIALDLAVSVAEIAIAWTLAWPGVAGVIVGARDKIQIDGWVDASKLKLDNAVLDAIEAALLQTGAGTGPTLPGEGV
jgi:aryl-alcohol dehydrogenase-like predicted oxidoreductase